MQRVLRFSLLSLICVLLVSCSGKVTQQNFAKITSDMQYEKVIDILGKPTSEDSFNFGGLSGTNAIWKSKDAVINIQFLNGQVKIKTFSSNTKDPRA